MSGPPVRARHVVLSLSIGLLALGLTAVPAEGRGVARAAPMVMPAAVPCNQSVGPCWKPPIKARWQYQLQGSPAAQGGGCRFKSTGFVNIGVTGTSFATGITVAPTVFDIDILQDGKCYSPQDYSVLNYAAVQGLHVRGAKVVGYIDAGTAETWRPDFPEMQAFDQSCDGCLFGNPLSHYPDEYWLNINTNAKGINPNTGQTQTTRQFLLDEMLARVKEAKLIGVDAIEFDDVDGYQSHSGLSISANTQLQYNAALANLAHRMGLSVGLKNDTDQAAALQPYFDFGIEEECWQYGGCDAVQSWPSVYGKAVFDVEYELPPASFCAMSNSPAFDINSIRKTDDLFDLPYRPCR